MNSTPSSVLNRLLSYVKHDPDDPLLRKDAIREACNAGYWQIARKLLDVGLRTDPDDAELLALSGFAHLQAQRYDDASTALAAALAFGIDVAELRYNLAYARFMLGEHADALEILVDVVAPETLPPALLLRARCLHELGRPLQAMADCTAYLQMTDDPDAAGLHARLLYEQGRAAQARAIVDAVLARDSIQLDAMLIRAHLQLDAGAREAARISFMALLEAHPLCGQGWVGLALLDLLQMRIETARRYAGLATARLPRHVGALHVLAWAELMRGNVAAAQASLESALAVDRNFSETHGGLAVVAALRGSDRNARDFIEEAFELDSQSKWARYAETLLLERSGLHHQAEVALDALLELPVVQGGLQYRELVVLHAWHTREQVSVASNLTARL